MIFRQDGKKHWLSGKVDIFENFIQAVRNRKEEHLDAHVYEGHVSSGLCHLANVSYRLGVKLQLATDDIFRFLEFESVFLEVFLHPLKIFIGPFIISKSLAFFVKG